MGNRASHQCEWKMVFIAVGLWGWLMGSDPVSAAKRPSLAPSDPHPETQVLLTIETRQFRPETLTLQAGQKVRLILRNHDAELHAFLPLALFSRISVNLSGNGAPQFGPEGFQRVLIPSHGQAEILFIPQRPGTYPYLCDLPGHVMRGTIVVNE